MGLCRVGRWGSFVLLYVLCVNTHVCVHICSYMFQISSVFKRKLVKCSRVYMGQIQFRFKKYHWSQFFGKISRVLLECQPVLWSWCDIFGCMFSPVFFPFSSQAHNFRCFEPSTYAWCTYFILTVALVLTSYLFIPAFTTTDGAVYSWGDSSTDELGQGSTGRLRSFSFMGTATLRSVG